ncbi:alpha/beta hydrolase [Rhizobium sp. KAs_5_22]|nr:alpha/beta hydrolase [Rhizobium sp. KAs_5_22]
MAPYLLPRNEGVSSMANIIHKLDPSDANVMEGMRAYLATLPKIEIVPEARSGYDDFVSMTPPAEGVSFEPGAVAGVEGWWCIPTNAKPDKALVHFHGGGYIIGSARAYLNLVSHLAAQAKISAFVPDYALAPEAPFPAAFDQALAVVQELSADGRKTLAISGDSAGGGLALATAQSTTVKLEALLLLSPWVDLTLSAPSISDAAVDDPILLRSALDSAAELYAGAHSRTDARISPRYGSFSTLPPMMVHVGTAEMLRDEAIAIGDAVAVSGSKVEVHVWEGMTHVFPLNLASLNAAKEALALSVGFLDEHIG